MNKREFDFQNDICKSVGCNMSQRSEEKLPLKDRAIFFIDGYCTMCRFKRSSLYEAEDGFLLWMKIERLEAEVEEGSTRYPKDYTMWYPLDKGYTYVSLITEELALAMIGASPYLPLISGSIQQRMGKAKPYSLVNKTAVRVSIGQVIYDSDDDPIEKFMPLWVYNHDGSYYIIRKDSSSYCPPRNDEQETSEPPWVTDKVRELLQDEFDEEQCSSTTLLFQASTAAYKRVQCERFKGHGHSHRCLDHTDNLVTWESGT